MGERKSAGRFTALTVGAIVSMIVLALAVLFANSYSAGLVTANARSLHSANSLLGSSAILRAANNQAALFSRGAANGTASEEARDVAIDEARRTLETFEQVAGAINPELTQDYPELSAQAAQLAAITRTALEASSRGDHAESFDILNEEYEPVWLDMRETLRAAQSETVANIDQTESLAGWVGAATRFLAVLLLPTVAIIIYRRIVRAQVRERRLEFESRLEYERKLSASKDELLAGVSHQLRTPVTGIYGMSDVLASDRVDPETTREFIGMIRAEAYELDRMVSDLLASSRLDAGAVTFKAESMLVADAVQRAVEPVRRTGVDVMVVADESTRAIGDPDRVVHIVRNLLSNARKHGGPAITISAATDEAGNVQITVSDDGTEGLRPAGLFLDFANGGLGALTTGSVGLGLSVARRLARGMGGDIEYERRDDLNTFVLTLPGAAGATAPELVETTTS